MKYVLILHVAFEPNIKIVNYSALFWQFQNSLLFWELGILPKAPWLCCGGLQQNRMAFWLVICWCTNSVSRKCGIMAWLQINCIFHVVLHGIGIEDQKKCFLRNLHLYITFSHHQDIGKALDNQCFFVSCVAGSKAASLFRPNFNSSLK